MDNPNIDYIQLNDADTIGAVFQERVKRSPDATAYIQYDEEREVWQETSWSEMAQLVARWQAAFRNENLRPGDRVAIMLRNCREWAIFDLAAQCLGLITVPLYTNDRPENIGYILQDAGIRLLLLENNEQWQELQQIRNQLAGLNRIVSLHKVDPMGLQPHLVSLEEWLPDQTNDGLQVIDVASKDLATIVYTSGTTGRSKGVMLSHHNILWDIESGVKVIDIYTTDTFLSFLPLSHTLERTVGYYLALMSGAATAYARSIPQLAEDLETIKPTILVSVPRIFERVYAKIQDKLESDSAIARGIFNLAVETGWAHFEFQQGRSSWSPKLWLWPLLEKIVARKIQDKLGGRLRIAVSGGAPLSPDIAKVFIGLGVPILQGYGLTETSPIISANTHENNFPASVGRPFPGIEVKINEHEELLCRAPNVMMGYWNNRNATSEVIDADGWFHTGDKAKIEDDYIFITGRLKEIIVMANGEKVPPADMEMCIAMDSLFDQILVLGESKPYLSAIVVLNPEHAQILGLNPGNISEQQMQELLARINNHLDNFPGYAKIIRVTVLGEPWSVENGLITPTLKLKRKNILERYAKEYDEMYIGH
ncbi:MAG: long-chain fatty acid--CoA ligase [Candidatus Thiodiazotropha sp. (ex Lucina aurantia)]|uniref:Long-chain fatty acid--CoA ligase n=1 Tax=Candidatus Thiodiazotropha taylori TaxID=2792791 RepID=A0A9E4NYZ5_9GAMM|nr:long-chain fatty acid--CoA ligase [Candidatus Thiodiazotropha sp. (ex Lucina pensylvanica)]MBT3017683.1 long-chain fatty acid--CoA ligase [Candidatus Thiodiazotropha taylori]MBT3040409.1 long-chain fatty acid--CoA ligase [Candidatus Thiodiazotropha sp. (ex Codakia orbicularis)]MBV2104314.1 long-chain fatty acid--CoA ligase [Candidatus Thiodiazotropha sp. (ex Lucina aurantia)]MCG7860978.1 long-chain fatty acid--CoA ligase [Candidatus Thiodiazotropha endolucinida]